MAKIGKAGVSAVLGGVWLLAGVVHAAGNADKCEESKLKTAGKYDFCRLKEEAKAVKSGGAPNFSGCDSKYSFKWQQAETNGGGMCPSNGDEAAIQGFIAQHTNDVAAALAGGPLPDCPGDLATCNGDLSTCNGNLGTCNGNLSSCTGSLTTCNSNYASCSNSLATCTGGTAGQADVLTGKTFSSSVGLGVAGTMPNNGAVIIMPGTSPQSVAAGYHNGSGTVAGDTDLVPSNIISGVTIFGVTGTAPTTCGNGSIESPEQCDAAAFGGATCTSLGFALGGTLTCTSGCAYDTSGCIGQAFPETGQTTCYNGVGTVIACAGSGQDGETQAGSPLSFTDNGDGTITDNNTKLMWEKLSDDGSIHDKDTLYTWTTAVTTKIATLNSATFAGHTDWRLPNVKELQSIVNYQNLNPSVPAPFHTGCIAGCTGIACACTQSNYYWSSDTFVASSGSAWVTYFATGYTDGTGKASNFYVRGVRGG